jgi:hypothetical protein
MSNEKISAVQNADKSVSSKRIMYIWGSASLVFVGTIIAVLSVIVNAQNWWPYALSGGFAALGVVHALVTGGYIKATDLAEIAIKVKGE